MGGFFQTQLSRTWSGRLATGDFIFLFGTERITSFRTRIIRYIKPEVPGHELPLLVEVLNKNKVKVRALVSEGTAKAFYADTEYGDNDPYPRQVVVSEKGKAFTGTLDKLDNQLVIVRGGSYFEATKYVDGYWYEIGKQIFKDKDRDV